MDVARKGSGLDGPGSRDSDERLLDSIVEDFVVAVHRRHVDDKEVVEAAERIFALATRLDWPDEVAADIEDLKRHLPAGWERRLWEASTRAERLARSGDPESAARAMREVVREIAVGARWRPLTFFGYSDIVEPGFLGRSFPGGVGGAQAWAERLHDRLVLPPTPS